MKHINEIICKAILTFLILLLSAISVWADWQVQPWGVAVNPTGTRVYVANWTGSVSVIDTSTNAVVRCIPIGGSPEGIAMNPTGTRLYVTGWNGGGSVSVIDTSTDTVVSTISVVSTIPVWGDYSTGIAVNPAGTYVYVTGENFNHTDSRVSVIDTTANPNTWVDTIPFVFNFSWYDSGIAVDPSGTFVYVAGDSGNGLSVIDTSTKNLSPIPDGVGPSYSFAVNPAGTLLYVTHDGHLSVIDTSTYNVTTIPVSTFPYGVTVNSTGTRVYVTNALVEDNNGPIYPSNTLSVIDTTTTPNTVEKIIAVGTDPHGVAVNPAGTRVYVANRQSDNVSVIDTSTSAYEVISTIPIESCSGGLITLSGNGVISPANIPQMYLSWTPSAGIVGIDHYEVYDTSNSLIASPTGTTYQVTNACNDGCGYYVKAFDNAGNPLAVSNAIISSTPPCYYQPFFADFEPNDIQATAVTGMPRNNVPSPHYYGFIDNSTDEDWYEFYVYEGQTIEQSITVEATVTDVGWTIKSPDGTTIHQLSSISSDSYSYLVPPGGEGYYYMRVWNANASSVPTRYDHDIRITPQIDTIIPSPVTNLVATPVSGTEIDLSWAPSPDNMGPVLYGVLEMNQPGSSCFFTRVTKATSWRVNNLSPNTEYTFCVGVGDAAENTNVSPAACASATTLLQSAGDTTAPTAPSNLSWTDVTTSSVTLSWNASSDNVGVTGYHIYNAFNAALVATTSNTSFEVTDLTAGASYSFYVTAYDAAGNQSSASNLCGVILPNTISIVPAPPGDNVEIPVPVTLPSGGTVTVIVEFNEIPSGGGGDLSITAVSTPPASAPSGFAFLGTIYYISTTAAYTPPVLVTFPYDPAQVSGSEANLKLFHWENGQWVDVTVSVDTENNTITGQVNTISPFGIGYPLGGGYSTGANANMMVLIAIFAVSMGVFLIRKRRSQTI